jgi:hypothetical protein
METSVVLGSFVSIVDYLQFPSSFHVSIVKQRFCESTVKMIGWKSVVIYHPSSDIPCQFKSNNCSGTQCSNICSNTFSLCVIFQSTCQSSFASLDLGILATSFCLLRLPKMPELHDILQKNKGRLPHFQGSGTEVDIFAIPYKGTLCFSSLTLFLFVIY